MKEILLNKKNQKVFGIAIFSTILFLSGLSYAYFIGSVGGSASTDVDVTTSVNERLVFTEGLPISINATLDNFSDGDGSLTGETTTNVRLNAGSQSSTATIAYQVYYQIETNNFEYSVDENTPELILTITDPEGNVLTSAELADGTLLSSESVTTLVQDAEGNPTSQTVTGFDITTLEGLIYLYEDYSITNTTPTVATEQNWTAKITFINLDAEQTVNEGKTLNSNFMLSEEGLPLNVSILNNNGGKTAIEAETASNPPDFSQIADTDEGMFAAPDNYGMSYYFRGAVDDNWVSFAGFYWRIVRINGDGSVRMIYTGTEAPIEAQKICIEGSNTGIGSFQFNNNYNFAEYTGYMYTIGEQRGANVSSVAKTEIDDWYEINLQLEDDRSKIADSLFCVDRNAFEDEAATISGSGLINKGVFFNSMIRNDINNTPNLKCSNQLDRFTVDDIVNGNGELLYPVAMLTADEIVYSGMVKGISNQNNFMFTNNSYWLISPRYGDWANLFIMNKSFLGNHHVHAQYTLRPVLSIKSTVLATGSGTWNDPYVVL